MNEPPAAGRRDPLLQATHMTEETAQKLVTFLEHSAPVRRLRASQVLSALIGSMGLALFLVGVEQAAQDIPIISNPYGSIGVGLVLLVATGLLLRKLG
jgi:hypothetical protein